MKFLTLALYLGLASFANADPAAWNAMREGDMRKLNFHAEPRPVSDAVFFDADGTEYSLADYAGKHVLVNFWALWCSPCREEMPALDALQGELGGDEFEVVTLAVWRNALPAIESFYAEHDIDDLPILLDPDRALSSQMAVAALPITVLLNPAGEEIARLTGDAKWDSDEAKQLLRAVMADG
ncbi:TlpA family protein disulfide reductase [Maribius pontilimi]|uniref:TlpA family protein disulfide reductase n=1 Tax=Palleronia pontilimi TaxID=1964209 RepID=A0A934I6H5_9RHOB|nr:TlpA disulfide reductase family protein [Palleronia pontilimi]MBJ3761349.1 TlpA family protein disulfide reductase [Palleronia pontilimi]